MASRMANMPAKRSKRATQLSPRAASPALCHDSQVCRPVFSPFFRTTSLKMACRPEIRPFSRMELFSEMQRGGERVENVFCLPQEKGYFATIMVDFYEGDFPGVYYG